MQYQHVSALNMKGLTTDKAGVVVDPRYKLDRMLSAWESRHREGLSIMLKAKVSICVS